MSEIKPTSKNIKAIRKGLNAVRADSERSVLEIDLPSFTRNMTSQEFWQQIESHLLLRGFKISQT